MLNSVLEGKDFSILSKELKTMIIKTTGNKKYKWENTITRGEAQAIVMDAYNRGQFVFCINVLKNGLHKGWLLKKYNHTYKTYIHNLPKDNVQYGKYSKYTKEVVELCTITNANTKLFCENYFQVRCLNFSTLTYCKVGGIGYRVIG